MEKIIWNDSFSVGVAEIDKQHQKIIEMINVLIRNKNNIEDSVEMAADTIEQMTQYVSEHFKTEERLMKEHDYPEYDAQLSQHVKFREAIIDLGGEIVSYGKYVPEKGMEKIIVYLSNWWTNHILRIDMKYKKFFNQKRVY